MTDRTVVIDCFPESLPRYTDGWAVVAVDVIRATTTVVTGVATGRRCFAVGSRDDAVRLAAMLPNPLLLGELAGEKPEGFDLNNSPADLAARSDLHRPAVILSSSGTRLISGGAPGRSTYVACLRNYHAVARHVSATHPKVAVIGAGSLGVFRDEDQLCCAWIAEQLLLTGYRPADPRTAALAEYWSGAPVAAIEAGDSAAYLRRSGQVRDLEFVLTHVDDLDLACRSDGAEITAVPAVPPSLDGRLPVVEGTLGAVGGA